MIGARTFEKRHIFIVSDWVLGQSLTITMPRFFTQRSLRNITFLTLRFFHFSIWQGALTFAFSSTSVNLLLFCFSLGGALTFAFSRSVVRSLAGPRARSLARLAARPLARPLARPEVARPPAHASARPLARPLARLCAAFKRSSPAPISSVLKSVLRSFRVSCTCIHTYDYILQYLKLLDVT